MKKKDTQQFSLAPTTPLHSQCKPVALIIADRPIATDVCNNKWSYINSVVYISERKPLEELCMRIIFNVQPGLKFGVPESPLTFKCTNHQILASNILRPEVTDI